MAQAKRKAPNKSRGQTKSAAHSKSRAQTKTRPTPIGVQKHLRGVDYPASKDDLVAAAEKNHAPGNVLQTLGSLPDQEYEGPDNVMKAYGKAR